MQSPVKGLEKLAQELRHERQKSTSAQQESTRLRIELERVKNEFSDCLSDLESRKSECENLSEREHVMRIQLEEKEDEKEEKDRIMEELRSVLMGYEEEKAYQEEERGDLLSHLEAYKASEASSLQTISKLESAMESRTDVIEEMERELKRQQKTVAQQEQRIAELTLDVSEKNIQEDEVLSKLQKADVVAENYREMQQSSENLRNELEEMMQRNADLSAKLRESQNQARTMETNEITLKDELQSTKVRLEKLKLEIANTDQVNEELTKRMDAESENASIARERAEVAMQQKEQVEQHLENLQEAYENSLKRCDSLEESEANLNSSMLTLQTELAQAKDDCADLESALEEAAGKQILAQEVETLRGQLTDVRKKLAKRDIEDDVDRLTPATMLEREKNNRKVYEKLIDDLREQVDKSTSQFHDCKQKLTEAELKLLRVEELEEQIQIYKENSIKYSHESMCAVENAQEERERNDKTAHEMRKLINDIKASENELHAVKSELMRVRDDFDSEKVKLREMHLEKLAAERKVAETNASKSRIVVESDSYKFRADTAELDVQRLQRTVADMEVLIDDLKKKRSESDKQRSVLLEKMNKMSSSAVTTGRERIREKYYQLERDYQKIQQENKTLDLELHNVQNSYKHMKSTIAEQTGVIESLRVEIADLKQEREFFRRDITQLESSRAEKQIHELRKDLAATAAEWQTSEELRARKEENISALYLKLEKEKDQVTLLRAQIRLLEDRVAVSTQELSIFRSLDIYHKSMATALAKKSEYNREYSEYNSEKYEAIERKEAAALEEQFSSSASQSHKYNDQRDFQEQQHMHIENSGYDKMKSSYMSYDSDDSEESKQRMLMDRGSIRAKRRLDDSYTYKNSNKDSADIPLVPGQSTEKGVDEKGNLSQVRDGGREGAPTSYSVHNREGQSSSAFDDDADHDQVGPSLDMADISLSKPPVEQEKSESDPHRAGNRVNNEFLETRTRTANEYSFRGPTSRMNNKNNHYGTHRDQISTNSSVNKRHTTSSTTSSTYSTNRASSGSSSRGITYNRPSKADFDRAKRLLSR